MNDLMKRMLNARFDAGAALRAKNDPAWRVFNKADIVTDDAGCPVAFRFTPPDSTESLVRPLDGAWIDEVTDKEIVARLLEWLEESRRREVSTDPSA